MVFHVKQSHGRGKRVFPTGDGGYNEYIADYCEIDIPNYWEGGRVNATSTRLRRVSIENWPSINEEVSEESSLGESEGESEGSIRLLQEGRGLRRMRRPISWSRVPQRSDSNQGGDRSRQRT